MGTIMVDLYKNVDGVRIKLTEDEVKQRQKDIQDDIDEAPARRMAKLRSERNFLLAETDWMANSDVTMSDAWKKYRQDLRDITTQTPVDISLSNITFPTKPS